ncbi:hypothetical protein N8455_00305 [Candidatus Gracilibacteria bacterium]|nr:hypothetical protein [Candidatus Gracilibacteria bacterium]
MRNYSDAKDYLEDNLNYDTDGYFGVKEIASVYTYAKDIAKNQLKATSASSDDKFRMLLDFDADGRLETQSNFYMGELQGDYLDNSKLVGDYTDLYKNLGFDQQELEREMTTNFFTAQEKFKQRLSTFLLLGIKPAELFINDGVKNTFDAMYEKSKDTSELINEHEAEALMIKGGVLEALKNKVGNDIPDLSKEADIITFEAINFIFGGVEGVTATFDISKFTANLIDNLSVGWVNSQYGVIISKNIFEKTLGRKGINSSIGLANLVVPFVTANMTIAKEKFDKKDAIHSLGEDYKISVFAAVSIVGQTVGVEYAEASKETQLGIDGMGDKLNDLLKVMKKHLLHNIDIKNPIQSNIPSSQEVLDNYYNVLKNIISITKSNSLIDNAIASMIEGHKDKLYRYAETTGPSFSSAGIGLAFVADIAPLPFITASFESINTEFISKDFGYELEKKITKKSFAADIVEYNGKKVLRFPDMYQISAEDNKNVQSETKDGYLYISGNIDEINVNVHAKQDSAINTIVIGNGKVDGNGLYLPMSENNKVDITESMDIQQDVLLENSLGEVIESTKEIRASIGDLFSNKTLRHKSTLGAFALQNAIFDYVNGNKGTHQEVFNKLQVLVNKHFETYAKELGKEAELKDLKELIISVNTSSESEVRAILQCVNANFMEKSALNADKNSNVTLDKNYKDINTYDSDNNRAKVFDNIFTEKYGKPFAAEITKARNEWLLQNGKSNTYSFKTIDDGNLASTGVVMGKVDENGRAIPGKRQDVMVYEGVYNIASVDGGVDMVTLPKNDSYINNLPKSFLENIQRQLLTHDIKFTTLEEVKDFINSGGNDKVQIDYELAFARMGECLNDAIILKSFTLTVDKKITSSVTSTMNIQNNDIDRLGIVLVGKIKEEKEEDTEDPTTDPDTGDEGGDDLDGQKDDEDE